MKNKLIILAVATLVLLASTVAAQDSSKTIAGFGIGYGAGETMTYGFAGVKVTQLFGGQLFTVYQRGEKLNTDVGGHGAALYYAQRLKACDDLYILVNLGALNNIYAKADGELVYGVTGGFGLVWLAGENLGFHGCVDFWNTGDKPLIMGRGGLQAVDMAKLAGPAVSLIGKGFSFIGDKIL